MRKSAFQFSPEARAGLHDALGRFTRTVVPQLEELARLHLDGATLASYFAARRTTTTAKTEGRLLVRALDAAAGRISKSKTLRASLDVSSLAEMMDQRPTVWKRLASLGEQMSAINREIERRLGQNQTHRGRPRNEERQELAFDVACLMHLQGVRVGSSRGGPFARVMQWLMTEMQGTAPEDVYRLIREPAALVNESTPDLRHHLRFNTRIGPDRRMSFWSHLLRVH